MNSHSGEPIRRPSRASKPSAGSQPQPVQDGYYGHEEVSKLCASFVSQTFSCPEVPAPASTPATSSSGVASASAPPAPAPPLANFIAYALHRTRLHSCVTFTALFLLARLKTRFPAARGSSGHRLFISAFMIASKVVCDDTYSNKSWCVVGQGMFSLKEINQMEREMCSYLEWKLNFDPSELAQFEHKVRKDYAAQRVPQPAPQVSSGSIRVDTSMAAAGAAAGRGGKQGMYPSPPDSPASLPTAQPPRHHYTSSQQQMTPPSDAASSSAASSRASSVFSHASAASSVTTLASVAAVPKTEPGYAYVSRSVW